MCKAVPIKDFPGYYITDSGLVYSRKTYKNRDGRIRRIKTVQRKTGYINIGLNRDNKQFVIPLHRLVANAFIPNPDNKPQVNHINGIKSDNRAENLEWVSCSENIKHSYKKLNRNKVKSMLGLYGGAHCRAIPVVRISNEGIKQYNSIVEAAQDNGVDPSNIVKCCKGKHNTCGGYLWAYSKKGC